MKKNVKFSVWVLIIGFVLVLIGAFLRIMHYGSSDLVLTIGLVVELIALILLIVFYFKNKKSNVVE